MTPHGAHVLAVTAATFASIGLYGFFSRLRRDRAVADTPLARVRSAAQGYVKLVGRTQPASGAPTAAPFSGRPCVWWDFRIDEERGTDSKGKPDYVNVERATSVETFVLADGSGQCLVGPVRADITPSVSDFWYGESPRPAGPPSPVNAGGGRYRYFEQLLTVDTQLCVVGEFRSDSETGDVNGAIAAKLHEWKQDHKTLLARFDTDHDGVLSPTEWETARAAAARECQVQNLRADISRVSVISAPTDGKPYLIAPLTPERLERRERFHAWGYFAFGVAWMLVCAWALSRGMS